jgi:hypothetical protein
MQDPSEDVKVTNVFSAAHPGIVGNDNEAPNTLRVQMLTQFSVKPLPFRTWR